MNTTAVNLPTKKPWYTKKWIYILVVLLLVGGVVFARSRNKTVESPYETAHVERGTLSQTVDASGNVESTDELDLRFESSGKISKIYTEVDKQVKAGTVLADLDLNELNARIAQSSASLSQAQASLAQVKAVAQDSIANAQAAVQKAELNLKLSEGGSNSQIIQNTYSDAVALILSIQTTVSGALTQADNIVGVDNVLANDTYEDVLSTEDPTLLDTAKKQYREATADVVSLNASASLLTISSPQATIENSLTLAEQSLISTKNTLYTVSKVLTATPPIGGMSATTLDTLKSTISTEWSAVNTKYTSLITQKQAIQNAKNSYATYSVAYELAKQNLANAQTKATADVASYEATIRQSQAALSVAVATRNKSRIIAPIAGTVAKVAFKPGEFVTSQDVAIKLVSPRFEVKVDIPETDIVKISKGVSTTVTLDAYGNDIVFNGTVTEIESGETVIQDVVYYKVTIALEEKTGYPFLNGMTADVVFFTEKKENTLYIPQRAVKTENGVKTVRVLENGQTKEVVVQTGLRGDDGFVEITSGLQEGQEIVVRDRTS